MRPYVFIVLIMLASFCWAEFSYVGNITINDTGKWGEFSSPTDVVPFGQLTHVLDTGNHRIVTFQNGEVQSIMGTRTGSTTDPFMPRAMFVAPDGRIYVANTNGNNVLVYSAGRLLIYYIGGQAGSDVYSLSHPSGISVYNDRIYVSDSDNGRIIYYSKRDRTYIGKIGSPGFGEGQLNDARAMKIKDDKIYIADKGNNKIQIFSTDGKHLKSIRGSYGCVLSAPHGVDVDKQGSLFVADTWNNRVVVFDSDGNCLETLEGYTTPFSEPAGISVDGNRVYVVDTGNNVVQVFDYVPQYNTETGASEKIKLAEEASAENSDLVSAAATVEVSMDDPASPFLETAQSEFSEGNYMNAYFNATISVSKSAEYTTQLSSRINSEVLKMVVSAEGILDALDKDAEKFGADINTTKLRGEVKGIRDILDEGNYADAAGKIGGVTEKVLKLQSDLKGSSVSYTKTRDAMLLEISGLRNELKDVVTDASGYGLDLESNDITFKLDSAYGLCEEFQFETCRNNMDEAMEMISVANKQVEEHSANVESVRSEIEKAYEKLNMIHSTAFLSKPDMTSVERRLAQAEAILAEDPESARELVSSANKMMESKEGEIGGSNLLLIVGVIFVIFVVVIGAGIYYVRKGKPKRKPKLSKSKSS